MGNKYYQLPRHVSVAISTDEMLKWFNLPSANYPYNEQNSMPSIYLNNISTLNRIDANCGYYIVRISDAERVDKAEKMCLEAK